MGPIRKKIEALAEFDFDTQDRDQETSDSKQHPARWFRDRVHLDSRHGKTGERLGQRLKGRTSIDAAGHSSVILVPNNE